MNPLSLVIIPKIPMIDLKTASKNAFVAVLGVAFVHRRVAEGGEFKLWFGDDIFEIIPET